MKITFTPTRRDEALTLSKTGDALTINGETFDFGPLAEGDDLPVEAIASDWIAGPVRREGKTLHLLLVLPHGKNAPEATKFPEPITASLDGPITLPPFDIVTDEDGNETEVHGEAPNAMSEGVIDWNQVVTSEIRAQVALEEWRETTSVSKSDFCVALVKAGVLSPKQAVKASQGGWPDPMLEFLDFLSADQSAIAQIEWASASVIHRDHEFIDMLSWWLGFSPEETDELFIKKD